MKFRPNRKCTTIAIYAFLVLAAAILFYLAIGNLSGLLGLFGKLLQILKPVAYGALLAFALNPMLRTFDDILLPKLTKNKLKPVPRRGIAITITWLSVFVIVALLFGLFLPQLLSSFQGMIDNLPEYVNSLNNTVQNLTLQLEEMRLLDADSGISELLNTAIDQISASAQSVSDNMDTYLPTALSQVMNTGAKVATGFVNGLLAIIISIYILFDREKLFAQIKKISAAFLPERAIRLGYDAAIETNRIFSGFVVGTIIDSLIVGAICTIGMMILRIPYPLPIGVLVCVTNIIPYFGPFIGAIPSALLICLVDPWKALLFLIFIIILQQIDGNIISPKILGNSTGLSALWVVFAILLFSGIFGGLGMLIGVPVFALCYTMLKRAIESVLARKGKSTDTRDYASEANPLIK